MFRSLSRTVSATVFALMLLLASVPAQASPFDLSGPSLDTRSGWFDVALSWLGSLMFGNENASPQQPRSAFEASTFVQIDFGVVLMPNSGSCIDPGGRPRPCGI
ncbi:MAG TPA: hypothetical protein VN493_00090 [Thermoanaerobaculia bacterium]|nr:hypothetical protein [Thermoanaerobaculia bacterium]